MAISKKPKPQESQEVDINALINKGGSVATAQAESVTQPARATVAATLRIPAPLAERIDQMLEERLHRVPRHQWILEAMVEKLEREVQASNAP